MTTTELAAFLRDCATVLERTEQEPYGPPASEDAKRIALLHLQDAAGGEAKGNLAGQQLFHELGGYLPHAAALALVRAHFAKDQILPGEGPDPS